MNPSQVLAPPPPLRTRLDSPSGRLRFVVSGGMSVFIRVALSVVFAWFLGVGGQVAYGYSVVATIFLVQGLDRDFTWWRRQGGWLWSEAARISTEAVGWLIFVELTRSDQSAPVVGQVSMRQLLVTLVSALVVVCGHVVVGTWLVAAQTDATPRVRFLRGCLVLPMLPLLVAIARMLYLNRGEVALAGWTAVSLAMLFVAGLTLVRAQYGWQRPERVDHVHLEDRTPAQHTFSLIVPAREEPVLGRTLAQLLAGAYPPDLFELVVVVSDDEVDRETRAVAQEFADRHPNVKLVTPRSAMRSKPLSLEDARKYCQGDLIGIVDAESLVAGGLLSYVNTLAVNHPEIGIFQGGVQLMNVRGTGWRRPESAGPVRALASWLNSATSWWRARNCLEYYIWFMSRLRYQAVARFIPLGGNTVFIRREVLDGLGGWDVSCLTEDCDLGVRASVAGVETMVFYHPELTTREETPETLGKLVVQRTRWMMGFIQVFQKGEWRGLPGWRRRALAVEMLLMPFFQAAAGLALPTSVLLTFFLKAPVGLVIIFWLPLLAMILMVITEQAAFHDFADAYQLKVGLLDSARLIVSAPVYQLVLSVAALRAIVRLVQGKVQWEKTTHVGAHHVVMLGSSELEGVS
ncbi:glycosyltransferase [Frankia sp. Cas3]|uniref:glycosyltransferase n=1 Tax=Frankia sp. Cas3 TaxID=3073926 RepID=UPI002AD5774A|nr:glycosyltransferase [Frankia sp. Cas3]